MGMGGNGNVKSHSCTSLVHKQNHPAAHILNDAAIWQDGNGNTRGILV